MGIESEQGRERIVIARVELCFGEYGFLLGRAWGEGWTIASG